MKYFPLYKCAMCGALLRYGNATEIPYEDLPKVLGDVIKNQCFMGNPYLYQAPMHIPHRCPNGNGGLAYFAGLMEAKEHDS